MGGLSKLQTVRGPGRAMASTGNRRQSPWMSSDGFMLPASAYYVTPELALTLTHVYCAVDIISGDFGTMTCQLFRELGGRQGKQKVASSDAGIGLLAYQLRWQPNNWQTSKAFWSTLVWQYLLRKACYAEILYSVGSDAYFDQLVPRHPDRVREERLPNSRVRFRLTEPDGTFRYVTQDEMFVVRNTSTDGLNAISRIEYGAKAIAAALALQEFTRNYFENGATAALIATYKGGRMEETEEQALHARISRFLSGVDNAGGIFVSDEDMSIANIGVEPEKAQLLGLKNISGRDVARLFKMPPSWLAIEGSNGYGTEVQDASNYTRRCQMPIVVEFEQALQRDVIVAKDTYFAKFNMDYLTRATLKERMESYEIGIRSRVIRPSEARELEDRNADDELDQLSAMDHRAGSQKDGADNKPKEARVGASVASVRTMLYAHDNAQRVLNREKGAIERLAKKHADNPDGWKAELKTFYADHANVIAEIMRLPIDTARAVAARHGQALEDGGILVMDSHWERSEAEALVTLAMDPESSLTRLADVAEEIAS